MAETPVSHQLQYPYIGVDEVIEEFGNYQNLHYGTDEACRAGIGRMLDRAYNWVRQMTSKDYDDESTVTDQEKSTVADCIFERVSYRINRRLAVLRPTQAEFYRSLSRDALKEAKMLVESLKEQALTTNLTFNEAGSKRFTKAKIESE